MTPERYAELEEAGTGITEEEWKQGVHFCHEFDGLLVVGIHGKGSMDCCGPSCPPKPPGYKPDEPQDWEIDRPPPVF